MLNLHQAAQDRFQTLWQQGRENLRAGNIIPAKMKGDTTDPVDYCLATIAPLYTQPVNPIKLIEQIKTELRLAAGEQFFYPRPSLHISLLACTQRVATRKTFPPERAQRVFEICRHILTGAGRIRMSLRGINLVGNQVFGQVFPHDYRWAELRQTLEAALVAGGETPLSHPDKRPVHLNLMRVTATRPENLTGLLESIERLQQADLGEVEIANIELVLTDFVVSASQTQLIGHIVL